MSLDDDPGEVARSPGDDGVHSPTCTNCGERAASPHTLRFRRAEHRDRVVDLQVCDRCLERITAESGVERV